LVEEKKEQPLLEFLLREYFSVVMIDTRCIEKEVSKVPIFEDGTFKYLLFTTTTQLQLLPVLILLQQPIFKSL